MKIQLPDSFPHKFLPQWVKVDLKRNAKALIQRNGEVKKSNDALNEAIRCMCENKTELPPYAREMICKASSILDTASCLTKYYVDR